MIYLKRLYSWLMGRTIGEEMELADSPFMTGSIGSMLPVGLWDSPTRQSLRFRFRVFRWNGFRWEHEYNITRQLGDPNLKIPGDM